MSGMAPSSTSCSSKPDIISSTFWTCFSRNMEAVALGRVEEEVEGREGGGRREEKRGRRRRRREGRGGGGGMRRERKSKEVLTLYVHINIPEV